MPDPDDPFDLTEWPSAKEAHDKARALGRRCSQEASIVGRDQGCRDAERELERWKSRLPMTVVDPAELARLVRAIGMGEAMGRSEADATRRGRTVFPQG